jgi:hypothetical protein
MSDLHGCNCKDNSWTAVLDRMPPAPPRLTVEGYCTCPTGGYKASLTKAIPQGSNPTILILDLSTTPPSGIANQIVTDYKVAYQEERSPNYQEVQIRPCNVSVPVKTVS